MAGKFAAQRVGSVNLDQEHRLVVSSIYRFLFQVVLQPCEMLQHSGYEKWQGRRCSGNAFNFIYLLFSTGEKNPLV